MEIFNQPLSGWVTSAITDMESTFALTDVFNQDISNWDVSNVTTMKNMFVNSLQFDQDLSSWDVSNVTDMSDMFDGTNISTSNYDSLLVGWDSLPSLQNGVTFGVNGLTYTSAGAGGTARSNIISNYSWNFVGDSGV
jgi:surface protein